MPLPWKAPRRKEGHLRPRRLSLALWLGFLTLAAADDPNPPRAVGELTLPTTVLPNDQTGGPAPRSSETPLDPNDQTLEPPPLKWPDPENPAHPAPVEPAPLPEATINATHEPVPEDAELKLRLASAPWNLAAIDSPLFGTEESAQFSHQINAKGLWNVRPHFSTTTLYDGNVFIRDKNIQKDYIVALSPGLAVRLGNGDANFSLTADYTATAVIFLNNSSQDSLDHRASLDLEWTGEKLRLGLVEGFTSDTGTSIDATDRVRRVSDYTGLTSHYELDQKVSFDLNGDYRLNDYKSLLSSTDTRVEGFMNYNLTPRLGLGIGGQLGYTTVEQGSDQYSEDFNLRAVYVATGKVNCTLELGSEFRQFSGGGHSDNAVTPVFGLTTTWSVREGTTISLSARRRIFASAVLQDQDYADTGLSLNITQRMTDRFDLSLDVSFDNLEYTSAGGDVSASREDNFFSIRPAIQWHMLKWCGVGLFYEFSRNLSSGTGGESFSRDRAGLQISIIY